MEPLSPSKSDGLLPQDLSKSSLPSALNLTRKSDDILLKSNSMEALRMVKTASWYSIGPGSSKGFGFPESDSDHMSQSSQQVQPDNAFSNATVTLSYVSRSRVFSSHNPSVCGLPSIHRKLSQHSPTHESDMLASEVGQGALHVDIDQCILQHAAKPVGLTSQSELFETSTQTHLMESIAGTCFVQQALEMNGNKDGHPLGVEKLEPRLGDNASECMHSQESGGSGCLHNCTGNSFSEVKEMSTNSLLTDTGGEEKKCDSEVFFLISRTEEPVIFLDNVDSRNLCNSLNGEYISPLEDPLSPPATSLDETEVVFVLPQTLSSPTGDNSIDDVSNVTGQEEPVDLSFTEPQAARLEVGHSLESSLGSNIVEVPITSNGLQILPADIPETCQPPSWSSGDLLDNKGISPEGQKAKSPVYDDPILNGSILVHKRAFQRKKLPPRSRRGKRLKAIVQNISPARSKSSNVHSINKCSSPKSQTKFSHPVREVLQCQDSLEDASGSERESSLKTTLLQKVNADNTDTESHRSKNSTSDCEYISTFKSSCSNAFPEPLTPKKTTENGQLCSSSPKCSPRIRGKRTSLLPKARQKSPTKQHTTSGTTKAIPTSKKAHITKRKRKKRKAGQSSLFSPQEPEIKLKYVNYKEEKRDMKADTFSPFIRMEAKEYSTCTVVNYAEDENARLKKGQQQATSGFVSGIIPTTTCLQLGRVSTESKCQSSLVCCLCGRSANAVDLGDLHGPYYPEGYKPPPKAQSSKQGLKEEDYSDSDSSFSARGRRRAQPHTSWPPRPAHRLKREDVLGSSHTLASDSEGFESPSSKRPRTELVTDDWYSPPVVPFDTNEYWVHEDCGIWSAGVFLVKGKLYGLEEAVRLAQETVCSTCSRVGATLGCFFKGCPNKYHYPCAMQSDCVLNEDNFSMKCTKHKNKSFKGFSASRQETR